MTNTQKVLRAGLPVAALAMLLTACGPDNADPADPAAAGAGGAGTTATAAASSAAAATGGTAGTGGAATGGTGANPAPTATTSGNPIGGASGGSGKVGFANPLALTATGSYQGKTKADVTPVSVVKGTAAEIAPFNFKPAEVEGKTPYYVTVSFTNRTGAPLTDEYFMMRFKVNTDAKASGILPAPVVMKSIPQCDAGKKPGTLPDGQAQQQCAVYLVPNGTPPQFLTFGSVLDTEPLVWKVG
ncbi:hypothetical protein [Streptomyces sp. CB01881]|uniref:hypothetical protein n=1 Tax=Streptomyces sp. CB01881 TaxID=2078691 RepID=UPI000CDC9D81|nr:hypothetical protein [Streptomyces sp. CB01881]AUY50030.1 hypothetical protein C2142_15100 [Streptomyces sp. CB01881]TYC73427.1 hypothetical protein EH183_15085 [Streptomyces sp. CB01881]